VGHRQAELLTELCSIAQRVVSHWPLPSVTRAAAAVLDEFGGISE